MVLPPRIELSSAAYKAAASPLMLWERETGAVFPSCQWGATPRWPFGPHSRLNEKVKAVDGISSTAVVGTADDVLVEAAKLVDLAAVSLAIVLTKRLVATPLAVLAAAASLVQKSHLLCPPRRHGIVPYLNDITFPFI